MQLYAKQDLWAVRLSDIFNYLPLIFYCNTPNIKFTILTILTVQVWYWRFYWMYWMWKWEIDLRD